MLAPDKISHLKWGVPLAAALGAVCAVALLIGPGFAVALGAVIFGLGLEYYQKVRNEGTASVADAAATATPGVVVGLLFEVGQRLPL